MNFKIATCDIIESSSYESFSALTTLPIFSIHHGSPVEYPQLVNGYYKLHVLIHSLLSTAWEQRKLGEYGYFYYGKSAPKWSVSENAEIPCVRYGELYTKHSEKIDKIFSYTNIPRENLKFSTGSEVLVPRVGEDPLDFANCSWLSLPNIAIGEMISVYNTVQNPLFTAYMFNSKLKYEFAKRVEGGNVSNLYYSYLENILISFPSLTEQKKITTFFESISNLITLHQREHICRWRTHDDRYNSK